MMLSAHAINATLMPKLPYVPALHESGVADFDVSVWRAILAAAATPDSIVQKLNAEIIKAMNAPEVKARIEASSYDIVGSTPEQLHRVHHQKTGQSSAVQAE